MTVITKPHTLNRPMAELRQLRERPELIETLRQEELIKIALFAISVEEDRRDTCPKHPKSTVDGLVVRDAKAA